MKVVGNRRDVGGIRRRGVVLILALGMLTLFTMIAITLAAISQTEATAAANFKRLEQFGSLKLDVRPDEVPSLFRYAVNQLIYDTRNKQSAIRGHSLLRDMYGSPEKYSLSGGTFMMEGAGAELRFRKADAQQLAAALPGGLAIPTDYQGVYNGTGLFLPKRLDLASFMSGSPPASLALSPQEIAMQLAYQTVPTHLGDGAATMLPPLLFPASSWQSLFGPPNSDGSYATSPGAPVRVWYPRFPLNYTVFDAFNPQLVPPNAPQRFATVTYPGGRDIEPELFFASNATPGDPNGFHWFGFDEDYDYPDQNNMFLALERADGTILIPSFHRPGLITQAAQGLVEIFGLNPANPIPLNGGAIATVAQLPYVPDWALPIQGTNLRGMVLRPRPAEYDAAHVGITAPQAGSFPSLPSVVPEVVTIGSQTIDLSLPDDIDQSGFIGDSPLELDVDTDGDGIRDAIWIDLGHPVITVGDVSFKPLFAFKVIDLDSKINLNVHGNLFRVPNPDPTQTMSYLMQHSSNSGATPTEINPMHALALLGDVAASPNEPPRGVWGFADGISPLDVTADKRHPYKRLLLGDHTTPQQNAGRWSTSTGIAGAIPGVAPGRYFTDDNQNSILEYSEGNGVLVTSLGLQAVQGTYSPAEFVGVGRRFEPFSQAANTLASQFGLVPGEGNFLPGLLNHAQTTTAIYGAHLDGLQSGNGSTGVIAGGLPVTHFTIDEAAELNPYNTSAALEDSQYTASEYSGLLRPADIDTSTQNNRLPLLNPNQFHDGLESWSQGSPAAATRTAYTKKRLQRMMTPSSWDLIRYNASPTTDLLTFLAPTHPTSASSIFEAMTLLSPGMPAEHPVAMLARKHNGSMGVSRSTLDILAAMQQLGGVTIPPEVSAPYQTLATTQTADGKDTLIPQEVLAGRRFDLNRPLSSYYTPNAPRSATNAQAVDLERESFAQQIYVLLYLSSGAFRPIPDSTNPALPAPPNDPRYGIMPADLRYAQGRVLAQLAVNIVDFIDPDTIPTQMRFDPDLSDGWQDPQSINPTQGMSLDTPASDQSPNTRESVTTVIGFELPELVLNEGLSIVAEEYQDDPNTPEMDQIRYEVTWIWAELMNPWPNFRDPIDAQPGVLLYDSQQNFPIYMIGFRDQLQNWTGPTPTGANAAQWDAQTVQFNAADAAIAPAPPSGQLRVLSRGGADPGAGYFLVGPLGTQGAFVTATRTIDLINTDSWDPPENSDNKDNDYTAVDFRYSRRADDYTPITVELKLYRVRNPHLPPDPATNPYIVIDYLKLQNEKRALSQPYYDRNSPNNPPNNTLETSTAPIQPVAAGAYYLPDPAGPTEPNEPPAILDVDERYSLQRKQPWHGYNSEWTPYGRDDAHPLYGDYLGVVGTNLEGCFLGLPSLADNGPIHRGDDPLTLWSDSGPGDYILQNAMRQNGFAPVTTPGAGSRVATFTRANRKNDNATTHWLSFPFLNRQLASPLELLSVRLYGSYVWRVGQEQSGAQVGGNTTEWRLRFTDDFEFATRAWVPSVGDSSMDRNKTLYERVWRSRQVPWYLDSRLSHPNWPRITQAMLLQAVSSPDDLGDSIGAEVGPQFQAPFPHLYRFFEFVECRTRMNNGIPAAQQYTLDPSTGLLKTQREDRVAGKINLNTVTEEEVYKGLVDSVTAMYFDLMEAVGMLNTFSSGGTLTFNPLQPRPYWPLLYAEGLVTPLGETPLAGVDPVSLASRILPWYGLCSSLSTNNALTVTEGENPTNTSAPLLLPSTGFELYLALTWPGSVGGAALFDPVQLMNAVAGISPGYGPGNLNQPYVVGGAASLGSPNRQFPGIIKGPLDNEQASQGMYPGTHPDHQVSSEMFRTMLMSRAGFDGITGTADDKPFRSYGSDDVSDTFLRPRNFLALDFIHGGAATISDAQAVMSGNLSNVSLGVFEFMGSTYFDSSRDAVTLNGISLGLGDYVMRLGGQFLPRLFDPVIDPYTENEDLIMLQAGAPSTFGKRVPDQQDSADTQVPADYWMLEHRRNEVMAKMSNNTTTRSHVFAVWVTVGFFRVEPGTESLKVPLLGSEIGAENGKPVRHRAFFIIDRSKAKSYDYEDIDANFELPQIDLIEYYKILE